MATKKNPEIRTKMVNWINNHEIFWLSELKEHLGLMKTGENSLLENAITASIRSLYKNGAIANCEQKGSERRYFRLRIVNVDDCYKQNH